MQLINSVRKEITHTWKPDIKVQVSDMNRFYIGNHLNPIQKFIVSAVLKPTPNNRDMAIRALRVLIDIDRTQGLPLNKAPLTVSVDDAFNAYRLSDKQTTILTLVTRFDRVSGQGVSDLIYASILMEELSDGGITQN
jgi:hypothetical protein